MSYHSDVVFLVTNMTFWHEILFKKRAYFNIIMKMHKRERAFCIERKKQKKDDSHVATIMNYSVASFSSFYIYIYVYMSTQNGHYEN